MGKILSVNVKSRAHQDSCDYKNKINMEDYKMLALVLKDLKEMFNAPIEKAIQEMNREDKLFPFR